MEQVSNLDSMYAAYQLEFEDCYTIFEPNKGFANYKVEEHNISNLEIYVKEVYVKPEYRGQKLAASLTDKCIADAEKKYNRKVTKIYTTIGIGGNTVDLSIRSITNYGFKILKADEQLIYFYKENQS